MPPTQNTPTTAPIHTPVVRIGKFKGSIEIVKQSWAVLRQDKEVMWFPILSAIVSIFVFLIMGGIMYAFYVQGMLGDTEQANREIGNVVSVVILFVFYLVMFFIVNFFEAGIYTIIHGRFNGNNLTFSDGIHGAIENIGKIFAWSCVLATVGIILRVISDRSKLIGRIVAGLLGAAWGILTYFSLASLIVGKRSVKDSFLESASVIRKMWGEAIIVNFGVGLIFSILFFLGIALSIGTAIMILNPFVWMGIAILFVLYIIFLTVISSTLGSIFKLALYEYATTGNIPQGFSSELIKSAVKSN